MSRGPGNPDDSGSIVVCGHVAAGAAILRGRRDRPIDDVDSGWQFRCGKAADDVGDASMWSVKEILEHDRTVASIIELPPGTIVDRVQPDGAWNVAEFDATSVE